MTQQTMESLKKMIKEELKKREQVRMQLERELDDIQVLEKTVEEMKGNAFGMLELTSPVLERLVAIAFQEKASEVLQQLNYIRSLSRRLGKGQETSLSLEMYQTELSKMVTTLEKKVKISQRRKLLILEQKGKLEEEEKRYKTMLELFEKRKKGSLPYSYLLLPNIEKQYPNAQDRYQICLELLQFNNLEGTKKRAALLDKYAALKSNELGSLIEKARKNKLAQLQNKKQTYTNFLEDIKFSNACFKKIQNRNFDFICNFSIPELERILKLSKTLLEEEVSLNQIKVVQYLVAGMRQGLEITLTEQEFDLVNQLFHTIENLQREMKERQKEAEQNLRALGEEIRSLQEFETEVKEQFFLSKPDVLKRVDAFFKTNDIPYEYQYEFLKDLIEQKEL